MSVSPNPRFRSAEKMCLVHIRRVSLHAWGKMSGDAPLRLFHKAHLLGSLEVKGHERQASGWPFLRNADQRGRVSTLVLITLFRKSY